MTVARSPAGTDNPDLLGHYAGFMSRLLAMLIDILIISFTFIAATWFVSVTATVLQLRTFLGFSINAIPGSSSFIDQLFGPISAALLTTAYLIAYHVFFWVLTGQTPGKALMGLRVVTIHGRRISVPRGLLRFAGYVLSAIPLFAGFIWVLADDCRQGWHDRIAGTLVIYTWSARPDETFLVEELDKVHSTNNHLMPGGKQGSV